MYTSGYFVQTFTLQDTHLYTSGYSSFSISSILVPTPDPVPINMRQTGLMWTPPHPLLPPPHPLLPPPMECIKKKDWRWSQLSTLLRRVSTIWSWYLEPYSLLPTTLQKCHTCMLLNNNQATPISLPGHAHKLTRPHPYAYQATPIRLPGHAHKLTNYCLSQIHQ